MEEEYEPHDEVLPKGTLQAVVDEHDRIKAALTDLVAAAEPKIKYADYAKGKIKRIRYKPEEFDDLASAVERARKVL